MKTVEKKVRTDIEDMIDKALLEAKQDSGIRTRILNILLNVPAGIGKEELAELLKSKYANANTEADLRWNSLLDKLLEE